MILKLSKFNTFNKHINIFQRKLSTEFKRVTERPGAHVFGKRRVVVRDQITRVPKEAYLVGGRRQSESPSADYLRVLADFDVSGVYARKMFNVAALTVLSSVTRTYIL